MEQEELLKKAKGRLEAMDDAIKGTIELLNDIYADKHLIYYLLWLYEKKG
jgi:hypothetical protein